MLKKRGIKNNKNIQFVNKKHLIDETVKLAVAFFEYGKIYSEIFRFLGIQLLNKFTQIQTKTYVKPTNTALLLHFKSHVDNRYKRGLLKTMLDRAFRLSSNWSYFSEECDRLKIVFSRLDYPDKLVNSTITPFIADKIVGDECFCEADCPMMWMVLAHFNWLDFLEIFI